MQSVALWTCRFVNGLQQETFSLWGQQFSNWYIVYICVLRICRQLTLDQFHNFVFIRLYSGFKTRHKAGRWNGNHSATLEPGVAIDRIVMLPGTYILSIWCPFWGSAKSRTTHFRHLGQNKSGRACTDGMYIFSEIIICDFAYDPPKIALMCNYYNYRNYTACSEHFPSSSLNIERISH
jgi:hypothetical protein